MARKGILDPEILTDFQAVYRMRGIDLWTRSSVTISESVAAPNEGSVFAWVQDGKERLDVFVAWDEEGFYDAGCPCATFGKFEECEHMVATLLAAADGHLPEQFLAPTADKLIASGQPSKSKSRHQAPPPPPPWERQLDALTIWRSSADEPTVPKKGSISKPGAQIVYVLEPSPYSYASELPHLKLMVRAPKPDGSWGTPTNLAIAPAQLAELPEEDGQAIASICGLGGDWAAYSKKMPNEFRLPAPTASQLLPGLCRTGRVLWASANGQARSLQRLLWVETPFEVRLRIVPADNALFELQIHLGQGEDLYDYRTSGAKCHGGLVVAGGFIGMLRHPQFAGLLHQYAREKMPVQFPRDHAWKFLATLSRKSDMPDLDLPAELGIEQGRSTPAVKVALRPITASAQNQQRLKAAVTFAYPEGGVFAPDNPSSFAVSADLNRLVHRDRKAESEAMHFLAEQGFRSSYSYDAGGHEISILASKALPAILAMVGRGWEVDAESVGRYRAAAAFNLSVTSGIDWFDVKGGAKFDDMEVPLPRILQAIKKGERMVRLDDGSVGIIPEKWFAQMSLLASTATIEADEARFANSQAAILDLLIQQLPDAKWDEAFGKIRQQLQRFEGIRPADAPDGFTGELRHYQREGLGWFGFLDSFGWGGCLADDMGLGKTVQVLALLLQQKRLRDADKKSGIPRPSLVVAPRSLIFNWIEEAKRFAPDLQVLDHTGNDRPDDFAQMRNYDLVLTTYGTLRRDITQLAKVPFNYAVLDESQAIKNASTVVAKSVRLLTSRRRLALSGTPIENNLRELWSLFEFLNPGMLGTAGGFKALTTASPSANGAGGGEGAADAAQAIGRAMRPFILRRTKKAVAKELPDRTELTIHCELDGPQLKEYQQLKEHYRQALLGKAEKEGMEKVQMQVLEALLRLRQAACHPGLIDPSRAEEGSPKLDAIVEQVKEVTQEGHKVLVFSQFTSFLSIVRKQFDKQGIAYEYLDGQTTDRQQCVMRFQNDPDCKLFLISLKAGGVGLNLTAAEYVFLLDPWWNPAVENQAIDRAHRIGQTRQVFAYRLITRGTVEEKVLELQANKRNLADAIINAAAGPLASLTRDDLEMLLS